MRIAYLFNSSYQSLHQDVLVYLLKRWSLGLAQMGHEVTVVTQMPELERLGSFYKEVEVLGAVKSWGWTQMIPFQAYILLRKWDQIHVVSPEPISRWSGLNSLFFMPHLYQPPILTLGESDKVRDDWPSGVRFWRADESTFLNRFYDQKQGEVSPSQRLCYYLPGPLHVHLDWKLSLELMKLELETHSETRFLIDWDWSEIPWDLRWNWRRELMVFDSRIDWASDASLESQMERVRWAQLFQPERLLKSGWRRALLMRENAHTAHDLLRFYLEAPVK